MQFKEIFVYIKILRGLRIKRRFDKERKFGKMKATGIVRRIDDLGRVVIPKEIRRTMRISEGDPLPMILTQFDRFCMAILNLPI